MSGAGAPGGMPGFPGGGFPGMNMDMLQALMDDPNIRRMTEAITQDPVFQQMAREMQESMLGGGAPDASLEGDMANLKVDDDTTTEDAGRAAPAAGGFPGMPGMPDMAGMMGGMGGMPGMDPTKYMEAMQRVMQNPDFMAAAESLGRSLMSQSMDEESLAMLEVFQNPANQEALRKRLDTMKDDPEISAVLKDVEENGQGAYMKYMNDPEIMSKIGKKFQEAMNDPEFRAQLKGGDALAAVAGAAAEEEEDEENIITVASDGNVERLKELLKEGADVNAVDEEGRTALHFTAGYNEIECMKVLLDAGADVNVKDNNDNSPLHYAAGYGNIDSVKLLLEKKADANVKNAEGKTAFEVAEMNEEKELAAVLKEKTTV